MKIRCTGICMKSPENSRARRVVHSGQSSPLISTP
jgi:hypothetical protein